MLKNEGWIFLFPENRALGSYRKIDRQIKQGKTSLNWAICINTRKKLNDKVKKITLTYCYK